MAELTFAEISKLLKYEPETGKLFWLPRPAEMFQGGAFRGGAEAKAKTWNLRYAGAEAFTGNHPNGYKCGAILGHGYLTHRVIWLFEKGAWPKDQIDHINGDRTDNRIENLREVSNAENAKNMSLSGRNKSGIVGVCWVEQRKRWLVNIGKSYVGSFTQLADAIAARKKAEAENGFHLNHGKQKLEETSQ